VERTPAGKVEMAAPREVIDQLVYKLYDLTDPTIHIVEEEANNLVVFRINVFKLFITIIDRYLRGRL